MRRSLKTRTYAAKLRNVGEAGSWGVGRVGADFGLEFTGQFAHFGKQ